MNTKNQSAKIADSIIAAARSAVSPQSAEGAHWDYTIAVSEMNTGDAFRALAAVESAKRRVTTINRA